MITAYFAIKSFEIMKKKVQRKSIHLNLNNLLIDFIFIIWSGSKENKGSALINSLYEKNHFIIPHKTCGIQLFLNNPAYDLTKVNHNPIIIPLCNVFLNFNLNLTDTLGSYSKPSNKVI